MKKEHNILSLYKNRLTFFNLGDIIKATIIL